MLLVVGGIFTVLGVLQLIFKKAVIASRYGGFVTSNRWAVYIIGGGETLLGVASLVGAGYAALFGPAYKGTCDERTTKHVCAEYTGSGWSIDSMSHACGVSVTRHACSQAGRRCVTNAGAPNEIVSYDYSNGAPCTSDTSVASSAPAPTASASSAVASAPSTTASAVASVAPKHAKGRPAKKSK
jgi:hypothetical protein